MGKTEPCCDMNSRSLNFNGFVLLVSAHVPAKTSHPNMASISASGQYPAFSIVNITETRNDQGHLDGFTQSRQVHFSGWKRGGVQVG
jgi:hypothetical protein